jgi:hypothetical protein
MTDGFQSVPADWTIDSQRKRDFFSLVSAITGVGTGRAAPALR